MPPTFDAKTSVLSSANTSVNLGHTGTGPLLYAKATLVSRLSISSPSATYDGVSMTAITTLQDFGGIGEVSVWELADVPNGAKTCAISWTTSREFVAAVETFHHVDKVTPRTGLFNVTGDGNMSVGVTGTLLTQLVTDSMGHQRALTVGSGQTERFNHDNGGNFSGAGSTEPGDGGTVTMSWSASAGPGRLIAFKLNFGNPGGTQAIIIASRIRDFLGELKRGLIPPDELKARYGDLVRI